MRNVFAACWLLGAASPALVQAAAGVGTLTAAVAAPGRAPAVTCRSLAHAVAAADDSLPAHCVVTARLKQSHGSKATLELWMPSAAWNGKFMMVGADDRGSMPHAQMTDLLRRGYAVAATDGDRVHEALLQAKASTAAYYGAAPRYSYWTGSGSGGGLGLQDVPTHPEDFDGIVVGAPSSAGPGADHGRDTAAPDLSAFKARGGKILRYHVARDATAQTGQSIDDFELLAQGQGGVEQTKFFYRLFLIPALDPAHGSYSIDWTEALEQWVEQGRAPQSVLAKHNPPPNASLDQPGPGALVFEPTYGVRLMCAYPNIARLQAGLGEVPVDWICQPGPRGPT